MQNSKARPGSLDVPQKPSPTTPRPGRKVKVTGSDSDPVSSSNPATKTPKDRSPKVVDRRSPRSPAAEKKRPSRASELEPQLAQLQEELKKTKDQLTSSESYKKKVQLEAEEAKKQLSAMSAELEETQKQLKEISDSEESRVQELRKISQDRDRAWQSELEAVQKQHSMDSAALASAMNEIQKLKIQLERVSESEASHARHAESAHGEIQSLRLELTETLKLVELLKNQLDDCRDSEAQALDEVSRIQLEIEVIKAAEGTLCSENANAIDSYQSLVIELEKSKNKANSLEEVVAGLQYDLSNGCKISAVETKENGESDESELLKSELHDLKQEADRLRAELEDAERRYRDEYIQSTLQIRNAYKLVEKAKSQSSQRETELQTKLRESKAEVGELRTKLIEKDNALQIVSSENKGLNQKVEENQLDEIETELKSELRKLESVIEDLKVSLMDKETRLQSIIEENEMLKSKIKTKEMERNKSNDEALALAEAARSAEREALMKLGYLTEEADKSCRKAARVTEQLDAAQNTNTEMEAELRKLKVQSDQWRKAAEAAAAMLSNGNNGKYVGRTGSLDYHTIGGKLGSPYSEDVDDDSPKKKNGNMLKKIGVLLKKGQK